MVLTATQRKKILVVEDDPNLSFLLKKNLDESGYHVVCCEDGMDGWRIFGNDTFDVCILDVMLPKQDGFTLAEMIRKKNNTVPILFLTARTLKEDVYKGFESGGDDYITKPFTVRELLLRLQAVLRRNNPPPVENTGSVVFNVGNCVFDYTVREIKCGTIRKALSTKENELLRIFCENKNAVVNRNRLLIEVWGNDDYFVSKSLDVYISRLRKILQSDPTISILNYHSIGYKMIEK